VNPRPRDYDLAFGQEIEKTTMLSEYLPSCAGQTVHMVFKFQMDGAFGDSGDLVWFEAPNRFTITASAPLIDTK
jgi:hypothetical protein